MSEFNVLFRNMRLVRKIVLQELLLILTFCSQKKLEFKRKHLDFFLHYGNFSRLIPANHSLLDYIKYLLVFHYFSFVCVFSFFQVDIFHCVLAVHL